MYRFLLRPMWIAFHLIVIAGVVAMISLGFWQLRRLDERKDFNQAVTERSEEAPVPLAELLAEPDFVPSDYEWRQVTVTGTWLDAQVLVFNRTQRGIAGDNVLTALATSDDAGELVVLVNRGFVALGDDVPDARPVETAVLGRIRANQSRRTGGLTDTAGDDGAPLAEVRRIELERLAPQYANGGAVAVAPVYVDLIETVPAVRPSDPIPVPAPELGEGSHLSYAFQWFIFAVCVVIGWGLAVRRSIGTRRAAA
jgi:cytochrome oxidase assembly protein ShyY1